MKAIMPPHLALNFRSSRPSRAFTLIELLVVVTIILVLIALLMPALSASIGNSHATVCLSNLRQQRLAMSGYQSDYYGRFPDHRIDAVGAKSRPDGYDAYWATTLLDYGTKPELYHDPAIATEYELYHGLSWTWAFDQDRLGYGFNGWFLALRLYADQSYGGISAVGNLGQNAVKSPSENICIADNNKAIWGQSIWWPTSGLNVSYWEGMYDGRHSAGGGVVFNDLHAQLLKSTLINPAGDPALFRGPLKYWDPYQRQ